MKLIYGQEIDCRSGCFLEFGIGGVAFAGVAFGGVAFGGEGSFQVGADSSSPGQDRNAGEVLSNRADGRWFESGAERCQQTREPALAVLAFQLLEQAERRFQDLLVCEFFNSPTVGWNKHRAVSAIRMVIDMSSAGTALRSFQSTKNSQPLRAQRKTFAGYQSCRLGLDPAMFLRQRVRHQSQSISEPQTKSLGHVPAYATVSFSIHRR